MTKHCRCGGKFRLITKMGSNARLPYSLQPCLVSTVNPMFFNLLRSIIFSLQCLVGGVPLPPVQDDELPGPSAVVKRRRAEQNFSSWLADTFATDGEPEPETDGAPAEESGSGGSGRRVGKRGRPMSEAAVAKANRERARRERLNEYLDELAKLCDPAGKGVKGDRVSVVADAIRVVQQLRVENNQLKQLNKFLEERTGAMERVRAQAMFQHAAQMQQAALHQQQQQQEPQRPSPSAASEMAAAAAAAAAVPAPGAASAPSAPVQHVLVSVPIGSLGAHMMAMKQEHYGGAGTAMLAMPQTTLPHGPAPVSWLPAPDLSEDQKLRPPAA